MYSFRAIVTAFLVAFSFTAYAQTDSVLTLQQCVDIAVRNNLQVKRSELDMETSRIYYNQARENLLPTINGIVNHSISTGRDPFSNGSSSNRSINAADYNLNAGLVLFNGMSLQSSIRQTSLAFQAGKMDFQQAMDNITLNLITAYLQVQSNTDLLSQALAQAEVSKKQTERLEILNKDGAVKPSEYYDVKGQYATDRLNLVDARNTLAVSKLSLLQMMNVPYQSTIQLQRLNAEQLPGKYSTPVNTIYNTALSDLALVKAAVLRRQSTEKQVKAARQSMFPVISLQGGIGTRYSSAASLSNSADSSTVNSGSYVVNSSGQRQPVSYTQYGSLKYKYYDQLKNSYNTQVSVGLSIPFLNFFQNKNRVALAKISLLDARYTEENTKIQLKQNVEQAYLNMTAAYERYQVLTEQVAAFSESFRTAEIRFNAGVLNSVDFVVAKNNMDRANTNLINSRYDYYIRTKILDYYQGKLTL
ncbi:outer membrane efflux protein [Arcticibacter svalbardensis MN12-7]|uniref:Outer membrane efflux protein n=1 Tax=Arcticibacter svalbardensis MN12-7 TaxID=1150600 RepID=R9GX13_9SPHI|nr:TolC family protein [Arcticibacter svalbardensis]EOR93504.1 outer membrane efflux protein [Arcticibacter svalbardensis MN12-7]